MKIPDLLEIAIEEETKGIKITELRELAQNLSNRYINEKRAGQTLLSKEKEALAYSIMRMPATFCTVTVALRNTLNIAENCNIETVLDIGAGTGAATWAIIAPCTHQEICKLPENDWCHTTVRVERNKIHKILKSADAPYEDEKFSYIAISKENLGTAKSRILRHPIIETGKITLKLCTHGNIEEKTITKKEKELFKQAKKKKCGDSI